MEKTKQSNESLPTCKAPGLPICEPEDFHVSLIENVSYKKIEPPEPAKTLHCDSIDRLDEVDGADEEEETDAGQSATTEEVVRIEQIEAELLKKKKLVDLIDERLSLNIPECPSDDSCVNMEVELQRGKVHPHILKLLQDNHQLRQQLSQAQLSCKAIDLSLKYLRNSLCRDLKAGVVLQRRLDELNSFKLNVEHEQALCRQRYRHLQKVKYEWVDCDAYLSSSTANRELELKKFVRRSEYIQPKRDAIKLLKRAKLSAMDVHNDLTSRMAKHSQRLASISSFRESRNVRRHNSDILSFLHRNDHLLGHETH